MRVTGNILIIIGCLAFLGSIVQALQGQEVTGIMGGFFFFILGTYLLSRVNKRKKEEFKKKKWEEGDQE